jgi:hypothetical protein
VRPFYNIINDLKIRLHSLWEQAKEPRPAMQHSQGFYQGVHSAR